MKKSLVPEACRKQQAIMSKHYTRAIVHILFAGLIAGAAIPSNALADAEPQVLGKTIGEWSVKWWQWALAIPTSENPMLDETGANCHLGQQGPVWFLAGVWGGGSATRSCSVPRGKYIFFSIANVIWIQTPEDDKLEPHCKDNETCWRQHANDFLPPSIGGELEATLDGNPIIFNPDTPIIRSQSPLFTASFPPDNVFGLDLSQLTDRPIVSDGFWVMLPPLSPGVHVLRFEAGNAQNVTYTLTVR